MEKDVLTAREALRLKDEILMSDSAYQQIRNKVCLFPPLKNVKEERKRMIDS